VANWLHGLTAHAELLFPQPVGEVNFNFQPVASAAALQFGDYRPTVVPPVKQLFPAREVMFEFRRGEDGRYTFSQQWDDHERVLAGVRPCDLKGLAEMDAVFGDGPADPLYLRRRAQTAVVAYACPQPCDDRCFCQTTGALDQRDGADVFLTPTPDGRLLIEALTAAGAGLLGGAALAACADPASERAKHLAARPEPFGRQLKADTAALPAILRAEYNSPVYRQYAERCYSCGTCNLVCPTCYCFDVEDDVGLDTSTGVRTRTWDACMNPGFAEVTGGHNFRVACADRQRHRVKRKFEYLTERFGMGSFCVGCGRCGRQCTTNIDIFDMVNDIVERAGEAR
jgi:ferredoxin